MLLSAAGRSKHSQPAFRVRAGQGRPYVAGSMAARCPRRRCARSSLPGRRVTLVGRRLLPLVVRRFRCRRLLLDLPLVQVLLPSVAQDSS